MHLKVQSVHQHWMSNPIISGTQSPQVAGCDGVHGNAGASWQVKTPTNPVVGCHSMVPEDQELDRQDHSSSMGSSRGGLLGISGSPARSSPRHTGNGSHAVHRCVQLGLGSLTRLTLDSGSAFLRSPHINILEMQAVISAVREFLPHLRSIVVRLMCDNAVTGCLHQE